MDEKLNKNIDFIRNLIKGRIAETIFEQMIREYSHYDILLLGYEHITHELSQYQFLQKDLIDNIRNIPDFALIDKEKKEVLFVEVKFRSIHHQEEIKKFAEDIEKRWSGSYLFLASLDGFYLGQCAKIYAENGNINKFSWVDPIIQEKYLQVLQEFEIKGSK
jgi:hypothetical protein